MAYVYDQAKADVLIDRGITLLLAALSVGPHIKALRTETGIPHSFIANASYYLRQADIWRRKDVQYSWLSAYRRQLPEGIDGLSSDANVAAGLHGPALHVWSAQRFGRHKSGNWDQVAPPPCGSTVSLARHGRLGEACAKCDEASEERRRAWFDRKARIQKQRADWDRLRLETEAPIDHDAWTSILDGDVDTQLVNRPWGHFSLDAPLDRSNANASDWYDVGAGVLDARNRQNLEWEDATFDTAEPDLSNWLEGRQWIGLSFPEVRGEVDELITGFSQGKSSRRYWASHRHGNRTTRGRPKSDRGQIW